MENALVTKKQHSISNYTIGRIKSDVSIPYRSVLMQTHACSVQQNGNEMGCGAVDYVNCS